MPDLPGEAAVQGRVVPGDEAGVVRAVSASPLDVPPDLLADLVPAAVLRVLPDEALGTAVDPRLDVAASQDALPLGLAADVVLHVDVRAFRGQLIMASERVLVHDLARRRIGIGPIRIEVPPERRLVIDEREARVRRLLRGEAAVVLPILQAVVDLGLRECHDLIEAALDAVLPDVAVQIADDRVTAVFQNGLHLGITRDIEVVVLDHDVVAAGGDLREVGQRVVVDDPALAGLIHDVEVLVRAGRHPRRERVGWRAVLDGARGAILVLHRAGVEIDDDAAVGHAAGAAARGTGGGGGGLGRVDGRTAKRTENERPTDGDDEAGTHDERSGDDRLQAGTMDRPTHERDGHGIVPPRSACAGNGIGCRCTTTS